MLEHLQEILTFVVNEYKSLIAKYEHVNYKNTATLLLEDDKNNLTRAHTKLNEAFTENLLEWCKEYKFYDLLIDYASAYSIKDQLISKLADHGDYKPIIKALNKNTRDLNFYELQVTKLIINFEEQLIYNNQP